MSRKSLFKYYSDPQLAEAFLDGSLLFRSLSYFRDYEERGVRGDANEGTAVYRPSDGLHINNLTQGKSFILADHKFESSASPQDIFVFCLSKSFTTNLSERFEATACVEILDIGAFCTRIAAALPSKVTFPTSHGRPRIGHSVEYYEQTQAGNSRWALPEKIATSKLSTYAWQREFRLIFSVNDDFAFEKVAPRLERDDHQEARKPDEHRTYEVKARNLRDICHLRRS